MSLGLKLDLINLIKALINLILLHMGLEDSLLQLSLGFSCSFQIDPYEIRDRIIIHVQRHIIRKHLPAEGTILQGN